ncbi:hypothetical protein [Paraclostridium bifermentans]|uniref:hypothetical protein n=1 Tax=Paraclostridium bifermentans TaxID=1490 RepID=UPI00374E59F2
MECENTTHKLNLFETEINDNLIDEEVNNYLNNIEEELVPVDILTGTFPDIKGDNNNLVNTLLTLHDVDLTPIANSFYTTSYCKGKPLDKSSKAVYASVYNQIVIYNIINTLWLDLKYVQQCIYTLDFNKTPKYLNQRLIINSVSYILRSKGINSIVMKNSIYCQRVNTNLCLSDKVGSTFDYLKGIIKSEIEVTVPNVKLNVCDITDNITVKVYNHKCEPIQNKLYKLDEFITEVDVLIDKQEEMKYELKDKTLSVEKVQHLAYRVAKVRAEFLYSIGKHTEAVECYLNLKDIARICQDKFYNKNATEFAWLENNCNTGKELTEKDYENLQYSLEHTVSKMIENVKSLLNKYKKTYLSFNMELSDEEMEALNTSNDLG